MTLRTRLTRAICSADGYGKCVRDECGLGDPSIDPEHLCGYCRNVERMANAVLAVLGSPSDADVVRVALGLCQVTWPGNDKWQPYTTDARAAIRALVGEAGE